MLWRLRLRVIVILRLRLGRKEGRRAGPRPRVVLVAPIGGRLLAGPELRPQLVLAEVVLEVVDTGDAGQAAAGAAQAELCSLSGPSLALSLGVQRQQRVVSLGETGIQAHFYCQVLSQTGFLA